MFWFIIEVPIAALAVITNNRNLANLCQRINEKRRINAEPFLSVNSLRDKPEGMSKVRYAEWCIFRGVLELLLLFIGAGVLWLLGCAIATFYR